MKRTPTGFAVTKRFIPAAETGSFGEITSWEASHAFGLPMLSVYGSGTWQGYTCIWTTLVELASDKPRELVTVPVHYDDEGAFEGQHKTTEIDGKIANIVPGRSFDVVYSGSKTFTERYLRRGTKYVVARGKSRMPTC
jgi:hypothetical protein